MKKLSLVVLLFSSLIIPSRAFAAGTISIVQRIKDPLILQDITLHLQGNVDLRRANITWIIDGREPLSQIGAVDYTFRLGTSIDPIEVSVRALVPRSNAPGAAVDTIDAGTTITPRMIGTPPKPIFVTNIIQAGPKDAAGNALFALKQSPPKPKGFEKVTLEVTGVDTATKVLLATDSTKVEWFKDSSATSSFIGRTYAFRVGPSNEKMLIRAQITSASGPIVNIIIELRPGYDGLLTPTDNAYAAGMCVAQSLNLVATNIENLNKMVNQSIAQVSGLSAQLVDEIDIIGSSVSDINKSIEVDSAVISTAVAGLVKDPFDPVKSLRKASNVLVIALKTAYGGGTAKRIARVQKAITFVRTFRQRVDALYNMRRNQLHNMQQQMDRQKKRCEKAFKKVNTHGL